ncbi:MAG: metal-dependent protease of the PAD1/JAB1 superfamily [Candidatus Methanoliparum thermophilum]|uniref:Metal-dependent protease of the PAD1/JAB1 superfamily n=1 Tax=Methanoliparum thermophilum TaxID=2491083 RepID=A0A520KQP6_METT2|nr:Mov34/MPN/PAD-1 family protein [Candidatus Methanoliparum sp. LAM-1]RZN63881.1 MAG: metal-dependent protease of the PAD1/JAB1 superfamily [Candidatus Methanoliparum thermophilum]BDC36389.1 metal-dependent protease of the PAD1/JAB1 superfamily [Candidatus Methanoliparum sp. LAM-1]
MKRVSKRYIKGIAKSTLHLILEISKSSYPNEFSGLLKEKDGVVNEVILIPGTYSSTKGALMDFYNIPIGIRTVGTVHSHPSIIYTPSSVDLALFRKKGSVHIITCYPYDNKSWQSYNSNGEKITIPVIDIEFEYRDDEEW